MVAPAGAKLPPTKAAARKPKDKKALFNKGKRNRKILARTESAFAACAANSG